ncbi:hypothetical protein FDUTEX481_09884 [Tolypothrix sp. PCC 7601]|nr:hypothetical protein FDUTEX481_09884 [Tolypothrix sp. PCC 7601]
MKKHKFKLMISAIIGLYWRLMTLIPSVLVPSQQSKYKIKIL